MPNNYFSKLSIYLKSSTKSLFVIVKEYDINSERKSI